MTRNTQFTRSMKEGLIVLALIVAVVVALPLLAAAAFAARILVVAALVIMAFVFLTSATFRQWLASENPSTRAYKGLRVPSGVLLHAQHGWARPELGAGVTIGVDDLVPKVLGPADRVELPAVGNTIRQGEPVVRLHRGQRQIEIRSPISGTVLAVNHGLEDDPSLVGEAPYASGWAVRVEPTNLAVEKQALRAGHKASAYFRAEVDRLLATLMPQGEPLAVMQDGGELAKDLHERIDDASWERIELAFFDG